MERDARKAASTAYKERKVEAGIYAVQCAASGEQWVGRAPNLAAIWNRLSFTLRQHGAAPRSLQTAWARHGADAFAFEILERMDAAEIAHILDRVLKERLDHWTSLLGAEAI
ncbi:hypothetical protein J2X65_000333 [Ancylobacter sp. 3268]|uniref:GIY-YIG nuclease family protein n=1 Tax=Ancylobacter sp. 3268 TaxID=2817752 RepID=UPI002862756D|nr:GIY-YIG nuclease family protein [Ancylobacter sp. 3268]MDR6950990.1 hypothetical protein [Ancylobacter sp. 3268]